MRLDFLIASAAAAHNEADREYSSFSLLPRLPVPGKQHASRLAPHVLHGLADGRQLRFHQPSGEDSVESGDDDVVGNPDTGLLEESDHAEGGLVRAADQGLRQSARILSPRTNPPCIHRTWRRSHPTARRWNRDHVPRGISGRRRSGRRRRPNRSRRRTPSRRHDGRLQDGRRSVSFPRCCRIAGTRQAGSRRTHPPSQAGRSSPAWRGEVCCYIRSASEPAHRPARRCRSPTYGRPSPTQPP